jgi:hypothetical protein
MRWTLCPAPWKSIPRIASSKLLPNKLTVTGVAAPANLVAGGHDGANQHERTARTRGRSSGALSEV